MAVACRQPPRCTWADAMAAPALRGRRAPGAALAPTLYAAAVLRKDTTAALQGSCMRSSLTGPYSAKVDLRRGGPIRRVRRHTALLAVRMQQDRGMPLAARLRSAWLHKSHSAQQERMCTRMRMSAHTSGPMGLHTGHSTAPPEEHLRARLFLLPDAPKINVLHQHSGGPRGVVCGGGGGGQGTGECTTARMQRCGVVESATARLAQPWLPAISERAGRRGSGPYMRIQQSMQRWTCLGGTRRP